jgi:t-SNARE complex subunit (syntaxin)
MVDALSRLRQTTAGARPAPIDPVAEVEPDRMADFWERHGRIQSKITDIVLQLDSIPALDSEISRSMDQNKAEQKREELRAKLREIGQSADGIRRDLEAMKAGIDSLDAVDKNCADVRMQRNQFHLLQNRFAQVVNHFTEVQSGIKSGFVSKVKRQFAVAGMELDERKVDDVILENPQVLEQNLFLMQDTKTAREVAGIYNQIADRHQDILEIERTLNELLDLFVQFAILVQDQGRMVDNIANNVGSAVTYVKKGTKDLAIAEKSQRSSRKCLCFLVIGGVIVLVVVIVLAIVIPVTKKKK